MTFPGFPWPYEPCDITFHRSWKQSAQHFEISHTFHGGRPVKSEAKKAFVSRSQCLETHSICCLLSLQQSLLEQSCFALLWQQKAPTITRTVKYLCTLLHDIVIKELCSFNPKKQYFVVTFLSLFSFFLSLTFQTDFEKLHLNCKHKSKAVLPVIHWNWPSSRRIVKDSPGFTCTRITCEETQATCHWTIQVNFNTCSTATS